MSNKKNETLKKVFRLTRSRKIAVIEPDLSTYQEHIGAFMRRMHETNTISKQQNHLISSHSEDIQDEGENNTVNATEECDENISLSEKDDHRVRRELDQAEF